MAKPFAWGLEFLQGEDAYRALVDRLSLQLRAEGAEIVVVMSELGLHKDLRLANVVRPGVDVFFSAHTHEATFAPLPSASGAVVVEAGNDGYLGRMDITVRDGRVSALDWALESITPDVPEDPAMAELVAAARAPFFDPDIHMEHPMGWIELPLTEPIDTVVGHTDHLLHRRNALRNPINDILAEVMRNLAGVQVSTTPGFRFDAVVPPPGFEGPRAGGTSGEITLEQLYRILPVSPNVAVGKTTGRELRGVVEAELTRVFSEDPFEHSGGWFGTLGGLELDLDLTRPDGERILAMRLSGSHDRVSDDEVITVVSCVRPFDDEGTMCSNPGFRDIEPFENVSTGNPWIPFEALREAFERGEATRPGAPGPSVVTDRGELEQWPAATFVQPLRGQRAVGVLNRAIVNDAG
jgi:2',3'-cyclic-nucleotide 2'-phosphodiesterase (5'-nucleotidase family)